MTEKNIAIIFGGGTGNRFGSQLPKQFVKIYGKEIIIHTLEIFEKNPLINEIYIGCIKEWIPYLKKIIQEYKITKVNIKTGIVEGGNTGQDTIYKILERARKYNSDDSIVLINDAVRPIITDKEIEDNIKNVKKYGSAITCVPFTETPIYSEKGEFVNNTMNRTQMYRGVAPQSFRLGHILDAHDKIRKKDNNYEGDYNGTRIVDSCSLLKAAFNEKCSIVIGNENNIKITNTYDFFLLQSIKQANDIENFYFGLENFKLDKNDAMIELNKISNEVKKNEIH